ncbi:MAG: Hsp70 family protein [Spirochaetes bacterium]|nr:Hsp70 family protein [Spirochaetota bacterium]MBU0957034.1 Hsp70 family protein [Spirochaetota bacterium]
MHGVVGIDFGTTNTLCAWFDGDTVVVIPNDRGERINPTVFAISDSGEVLTGASARNQALADPESAFMAVKRSLGSVESVTIAGRNFPVIEIAAAIIKKVKQDAEHYLGFEVKEAVITVPARFSDPQRRAVRAAAGIAGLKTARILNEPTAAALAKSWASLKDVPAGRILVYDFGGGTFDVSVLSMDQSACRVLASEGDSQLGGVDLDQLLFAHVAGVFSSEFGIDLSADPYLVRHVTDLCERAKIELSSRQEATIAVPFLQSASGLAHPKLTLSRTLLEQLIAPLIDRSITLTQKVLNETKIKAEHIDMLILSGGSSRIPLVTERLLACGLRKPDVRVNPEEVVAIGAAIEAARLQKRLSGFSFTDVCSRTFGLEIEDGSFIPILPKNTALPARRKREFTTVEDFQSAVEIHVLQTASTTDDTIISVGKFLLSGIRKANKGQPRIEVDFYIDEGDILKVHARDLDTGAEQSVAFFEGSEDSLPPLQRLAWLSQRLSSAAVGLSLDTAMEMELAEMLEHSTACQREQDSGQAQKLLPLLEVLLTELSVRTEKVVLRER